MTSLKIYAEDFGKRTIIIFILLDLKRQSKEDTVSVLKAKTRISNLLWKQSLFKDDNCCIQVKIEMIWKN